MPYRKSKPWGNVKPPPGSVLDDDDPINTGLVGCWLFNENGGRRVKDIARGNDGTLTNFASPDTSTSGWVPGKFGPALAFDGTDDNIPLPLPKGKILGTNAFTIALWVRVSALNQLHDVWSTNGEQSSLFIEARGGFTQRYQLQVSQFGGPASISYNVTVDTQWHHLACTWDGVNARIYFDGALRTQASGTYTIARDMTILTVSYPPGFAYLNGKISHCNCWARAVLPSEIQRLYAEPFAGIVAPRRRVISGVAATTGGLLMRRRRMMT